MWCDSGKAASIYAAEIEKQKVDGNQPYADVRSVEFVFLKAGKIVKMKRHRVEVHVSSGSSSSENSSEESGSSSSEEEERKQICKHQEAHKEQKKMKRGRKNEAQKECQTKETGNACICSVHLNGAFIISLHVQEHVYTVLLEA